MRKGAPSRGRGSRRGGFTLVELLVVIFIILIVSAATLPVVLPALNRRQASEAARQLQGAIVGAQDAAVHANAPRGIRLMPDPTFPYKTAAGDVDPTKILVSNRIVPLETAPDYSEGRLTPYRSFQDMQVVGFDPRDISSGGGGVEVKTVGGVVTTTPAPALVVEEALYDKNGFRNNPTSWFWNVRVGDKIRIGKSGWLYTVTGPMVVGPEGGNVERFVNIGPPGQEEADFILGGGMEGLAYPNGTPWGDNDPPWGPREYLFLVNGVDDNRNGFIDEGFDGIDNDLVNGLDDFREWEIERWVGGVAGAIEADKFPMSLPYTIVRRPVPSSGTRETTLPADMVIDLTTWGDFTTWGLPNPAPERSRLPVDPYTGYVDIMFSPRGEVIPTTIYSTPASSPMTDAFYHFWLAERQDLHEPIGAGPPYLPITQGLVLDPDNPPLNALKGEQRILTLFTRTGQTVTNPSATFLDPVTGNYSPNRPFISAQQGARGGQ